MAPKRKAEEELEVEVERQEKKIALPQEGAEHDAPEAAPTAVGGEEAVVAESEEGHHDDEGEEEEEGEEKDDGGEQAADDNSNAAEEPNPAGSSQAAKPSSSANTSEATNVPPPSTSTSAASAAPVQTDWQAVFSPAHGAYYFYNAKSGETTWVNPLDPSSQAQAQAQASGSAAAAAGPSTSIAASAATNPWAAPATNTAAEGIDPLLYHLDPTLASSASGPSGQYTAQARFNAHTGRFEADPTKRPEKMSEYERAKRMSEVYFDTERWQAEVAERKEREEAEGRERKRVTKKDLERFAEAKKRKKMAKTAWLRN